MDVVPVAGEGDGENENNDYDEADILQPFVWCRRIVVALLFARAQSLDHGAIVIQQMAAT